MIVRREMKRSNVVNFERNARWLLMCPSTDFHEKTHPPPRKYLNFHRPENYLNKILYGVGCSEVLWKSRDSSVSGAIGDTLGVVWKCFGVFTTLLGLPNPYNTRNMSQPRIFRKPDRYTVSEGFSLEKVKHRGKSGKS